MTEGEAWTRDELRALRVARFSPVAATRFLLASQRRANAVRAARPALARQAAAWTAAGAAAWALPPVRHRAPAGLAWWGACAVMVDWHLGMCETPAGEPRPLRAADALTALRAWLVPLVAARPAVVPCLAGAASDVLDGVFARRSDPTRLGHHFDALADVCFAAAALRGAARSGAIGRVTANAELARQGLGLAYALWAYFGRATAPDPRVTRAARRIAPARTAGLICAARGHRRTADALMLAASTAGLAALLPAPAQRGVAAGGQR